MDNLRTLILSIDTSAINCSVVISENNNLLLSYSINLKKLHDKLLADFVKRALSDLSLPFSKISAVAISSGPGSFTGLRIGASFVKALTIDNSPKLIPLPTLQLFSIQAESIAKAYGLSKITSIISANSGMIYSQLFDNNSNCIHEPMFMHSSEVEFSKDSLYCCDTNRIFSHDRIININNIYPETLAEGAYRKFQTSSFIDATLYEPEYIQDFVFKG